MTTINHQKEDSLAKRVLERIAEERVTPRPQWEFALKNYFFWGLGAFAVLLGALAFSVTIFEVENVDWRLASVTHSNFLSFFLDAAPFLWVGALALFILIGYVNVRRTNRGYRYPLAVIALGAVLTSLTLGTALYATGFGGVLENISGDHLPFHRSILNKERSWWLAPEHGLLGGEVVSVAPDATAFMLRDFKGQSWRVEASDLRTPDLASVVRGGVVHVVGLPVSEDLLPGNGGATATTSEFHACFVLPSKLQGDFRHEPPPLPFMLSTMLAGRSPMMTRSEKCRGIRPYQQLRTINDTGF